MKVLYYTIFGIMYVLSLLPLCILYLISDFFFVVVYYIIHYRRTVVRTNLAASFPEKSKEELRDIEWRFYRCLCDYFVETVKMMTMSEKQMRRRMVFKGIEVIDNCIGDGQSVAVSLGHIFNWEWVTSLPLWAPSDAKCGQIYHALENQMFDHLFLRIRQRWGSECIEMREILRKTIDYKRKGQLTIIGYIGDQVPHWNNIHHWCQFLNHDTPVMTGMERIAIKNHQALVYLNVRRVKRGYYEAEFQLITQQPEELKEFETTDIYYRKLEENIRMQPELWLWSHNRWKRTREEFDSRFKVVNGKVVPK